MKILIPTDGSEVALRAVAHVIRLAQSGVPVEIRLINVQPPLPQAVTTFVPRENVRGFHDEEGCKALVGAEVLLGDAGIAFESDIAVGDAGEVIAERAAGWPCDQIVMGTRGLSPIANLLLGSTTTRLLHLTPVPVTLVK